MTCDTEWRALDRNLEDAVVSDYTQFIVASCVRRRVLHFFFSALYGVQIGVLLRGTTEYALMGFKILLSTIYSNTGSFSESEKYISAYPLDVGIGAACFGRRRSLFSIGAGGTLE